MPGRSFDHCVAEIPPLVMGISRDSPVRLSVIVMLSATDLYPPVASTLVTPILDRAPSASTSVERQNHPPSRRRPDATAGAPQPGRHTEAHATRTAPPGPITR